MIVTCWCFVSFSHNIFGWSAMCNCGIPGYTHLHLNVHTTEWESKTIQLQAKVSARSTG